LRCCGLSLDACLQKLRYVKRGDEIRGDDLNTKVDCLKALSDWLRRLGVEDPLVDELDAVLSKIPYVKSGDIIQPEHHNLVVDALWKTRDILFGMESEYMKIIELMKERVWALGIGLEYAFSPTIRYYYKLGTINYMSCNLYNISPYNEMVLEKFTAS
jgi:hypothetical protein